MFWSVKARVKTCHSSKQCVLFRFWRSKMFWSHVAFVFVGRFGFLFWSSGIFLFFWLLPICQYLSIGHDFLKGFCFSPALVTCSLPSICEYIPICYLNITIIGSVYIQLYCPCRISIYIMLHMRCAFVHTESDPKRKLGGTLPGKSSGAW